MDSTTTLLRYLATLKDLSVKLELDPAQKKAQVEKVLIKLKAIERREVGIDQ